MPKAALGGGDMFAATNSREATAALFQYLLLDDEAWTPVATNEGGHGSTRISANVNFDTSLYEKEITRVLAATINAALSENAFDLMHQT